MSSYAGTAEASPEQGPAEPEASSIALHLARARKLGTTLRVAGLGNTVRMISDRVRGVEAPHEREFDREVRSIFRHPITLAAALSDMYGYCEIVDDDVYALPEEIEASVDGKPIVDVGAYIGLSAAYFATRYPRSPVMAIEPHPRNYRLLGINAARYDGQIDARHAALSPSREPVGMRNNDPPGVSYMSNVFLPDFAGEDGATTAEGMTPEDILTGVGSDARIGILKVDIEGAENRLFRSPSIDPLLERTDLLMIETHDRFEVGQGSSHTVEDATARNGLSLAHFGTGHTRIYAR